MAACLKPFGVDDDRHARHASYSLRQPLAACSAGPETSACAAVKFCARISFSERVPDGFTNLGPSLRNITRLQGK